MYVKASSPFLAPKVPCILLAVPNNPEEAIASPVACPPISHFPCFCNPISFIYRPCKSKVNDLRISSPNFIIKYLGFLSLVDIF
jgi:hypothetical protein